MVNILGYQGNAGLGLGSNPNLPVSDTGNSLDVINQTSRDLAMWSNQQNAALFEQKIKDRDAAMAMIANDQVSTGGILPEYMPEVRKATDEVAKEFKSWKGNMTDIDGYTKYKTALQKANDLAKIAQINTLGIQDIRKQKSQEPIKYRQADYDKFEKQEIGKGLDNIVNPYQKTMYSDISGMTTDLNQTGFDVPGALAPNMNTTQKTTVTDTGGKLKTTQTTTTKPATGKGVQPVNINPDGTPSLYTKQPDKIFNYDNVLGRATMRFMELGAPKEQQDLLIAGVQNAPPTEAKRFLGAVNERIRLYNEQTKGKAAPVRELKEGEDFAEITDPTTGQKRIMLNVNTPEFAAKVALAQQPGNYFEAGAEVFNKDAGDFLIKNKKLAIDREKLGLDKAKANAYIENLRTKTKKLMDDGVDETQVKMVVDQFSDDFVLGVPVERTQGDKKSIVGDVNVFYMDKVPSGYRNVVGPIYDKKGKLTSGSLKPFTNIKDSREYLKGKMYDRDGKEIKIDNKSIQSAYEASRKAGFNGSLEDYKNFTNDYYKQQIRNGSVNLLLEDSEGNKVTPSSILDAYRAINNANASKKGQQQLFVETEDTPENSNTTEE